MRSYRPGHNEYPMLYVHFANAQEIADVINRSLAYVHRALAGKGFTLREQDMLARYSTIPAKRLFTPKQRGEAIEKAHIRRDNNAKRSKDANVQGVHLPS